MTMMVKLVIQRTEAAFVMEMFKLGLRVHENKLNKDENQKSLDDKLKLIAGMYTHHFCQGFVLRYARNFE